MNRKERRASQSVGRKSGMSQLSTAASLYEALQGITKLAPAVEGMKEALGEVHQLTDALVNDYQTLADEQAVHGWLIENLYALRGVTSEEYAAIKLGAQRILAKKDDETPTEGT